MIDSLTGILKDKLPTYVLIEVNGVGYGVHVPLSTYHKLPEISEEIRLFTHLAVREDDLSLYGFYTLEEKRLFSTLISISGVGPRSALTILSSIETSQFHQAIIKEDMTTLTSISGIGKKTAQRLILELKDKLKEEDYLVKELLPETKSDKKDIEDAILALISLGYKKDIATQATNKAQDILKEEFDIEQLIKTALKFL
ncbi:MAG: Holliday junction branch migration protein RuvA [bacterium]|nr:Holliday junction branch migration protein RuvA [bacterium]